MGYDLLRIPGVAAVKVEPSGEGDLLVLSEGGHSIVPGRRALSEMTWQAGLRFQYSGATPADNVIDFCRHPSGEISVALASEHMYSLVRLSSPGQLLHRTDIKDVPLSNLLRSGARDGDGGVIAAGFENDPGIHSEDQNATQIKADLYVVKIQM